MDVEGLGIVGFAIYNCEVVDFLFLIQHLT